MLSRIVRNVCNSLLNKQTDAKARSPMFENLEKRELMAVSPIIAGTKIKGVNLSSGGVSTNQTLITIPFTGNIKILDASKLQLRGYAINPLTGGQRKMVVPIVKAEVLAADHRYLQITSGCLMRKGGQIQLNEGALGDDNNDTLAGQTLKTVKGQNKERFTLARRGFVPTDVSRFTQALYSGAPAETIATADVSEATVTANLTAFLAKKVTGGIITAAQRDAALAKYNNATSKSIIANHNLRAALISLTGTFAESAIACYLDGANSTGKAYTIVTFQDPTDAQIPVAQSSLSPSNRLSTIVRTKFANEDFRALSAFLAHEALHQDGINGLQEETYAVACETLAYGQQAQTDTSFLDDKTSLVNFENERLLALIQSGRTIFPYVGLFDAPLFNSKGNIFPGAIAQTGGNFTSYENYIRRQYIARGAPDQVTNGNNMLRSYFTAITTQPSSASQKFNGALLSAVDAFQSPISTKGAIQLAGALRLAIV